MLLEDFLQLLLYPMLVAARVFLGAAGVIPMLVAAKVFLGAAVVIPIFIAAR